MAEEKRKIPVEEAEVEAAKTMRSTTRKVIGKQWFQRLTFRREYAPGDWGGTRFRLVSVDQRGTEYIGEYQSYEGVARLKVTSPNDETREYASVTEYHGGAFPGLMTLVPQNNTLTDRQIK